MIKKIIKFLKLLLIGDYKGIYTRLLIFLHRSFLMKDEKVSPLFEGRAKKIIILSTPHCLFLAHLIKNELTQFKIESKILTKASFFSTKVVYIVIAPNAFKKLPKNYIACQMEQSINDRWFTQGYFEKLRNAIAIFDYSEINIRFLISRNIEYKKIFYLPLSIFPDFKKYLLEYSILNTNAKGAEHDVLFYGDITNDRRKKYLNELEKSFNVKRLNNTFDADLFRELLNSKIVVNLHYYENALLETHRIYEALSLGCSVVSEKSTDFDLHKDLMGIVDFADVDDIDGIKKMVSKRLECPNRELSSEYVIKRFYFSYYFSRFLLAKQAISYNDFYQRIKNINLISGNMVCLSLPETPDRIDSFFRDYRNYGFEIFNGLRHDLGWIGCGLSYKLIINIAKDKGYKYIIVCEDDVILPKDFDEKLSIILEYLSKQKWDIFAGVIADLHEDVLIKKIDSYKGIEFIHIDKMTSMVFNIYNETIFDLFLKWDETNFKSPENNIDRILELQKDLKVITTNPFLFGHKVIRSSLWNHNGIAYQEMFIKSLNTLNTKKSEFINK